MRPAFSVGLFGIHPVRPDTKSGSDFGNAVFVKRLHDDPFLSQLDRFTLCFRIF